MQKDKALVVVLLVIGCFNLVFAEPTEKQKTTSPVLECEKIDQSLTQIRAQKKQKQLDCTNPNLSELERKKAREELAKLEEIERKLVEERLKILFVDVNSVMETIASGMDWTANMLDGYFAEEESGRNQAKAWGHIVFAWEPKTGELFDSDRFPVKFKVKAKLPNLQNKVELILSDGEDDDFQTLPYESVRPEALRLSQSSLGAAIQLLSSKGENTKVSYRVGVGDRQLYARTSWIHRQKFMDDLVTFNVAPAIEYYASDGWGARVLFDTSYKLSNTSEMRFDVSFQNRQAFDDPKFRWGVFNIKSLGQKKALITGFSSAGEIELHGQLKAYTRRFSTRYRFNALRSWVYFEIEPFIEFSKDDPDDFMNIGAVNFKHKFVRDRGITIRFEGHYGFL